jgi:hypothetical protein
MGRKFSWLFTFSRDRSFPPSERHVEKLNAHQKEPEGNISPRFGKRLPERDSVAPMNRMNKCSVREPPTSYQGAHVTQSICPLKS